MKHFYIFFILLSICNFTCRKKTSYPETLVKFEVFSPDEIILPYCGNRIPCHDNELFYLSVYNGDPDTILALVEGVAPFIDNLLMNDVFYCEIVNGDTLWAAGIPSEVLYYTDTIFPNCKKIYPMAFGSSHRWLNSSSRWILVHPFLYSNRFDEIEKNIFFKEYPLIVLTRDSVNNKIIDVSKSFLKTYIQE